MTKASALIVVTCAALLGGTAALIYNDNLPDQAVYNSTVVVPPDLDAGEVADWLKENFPPKPWTRIEGGGDVIAFTSIALPISELESERAYRSQTLKRLERIKRPMILKRSARAVLDGSPSTFVSRLLAFLRDVFVDEPAVTERKDFYVELKRPASYGAAGAFAGFLVGISMLVLLKRRNLW